MIGENPAWASKVLDLRQPAVREFLLDQLIAPAMERDFKGIFLDTLDSFALTAAGKAEPEAFARGQQQLLEAIRSRYPDSKIVINRGFHLPPGSESLVDGMAFESYRKGYDPGRGRYVSLPDSDRQWLDGQLARWREARPDMPIIAIDYVEDPADAPAVAARLRLDGFVPYVTDPDLVSLGPATPAQVTRHVLVLHDLPEITADQSQAHRKGGLLLERLGLIPAYRSTLQPLPREPVADRYAGILVWPQRSALQDGVCDWLVSQQQAGVPVVVIGQLPPDPACRAVMAASATGVPAMPLSATLHHPSFTTFEGRRLPAVVTSPLVMTGQVTPWVTITDSNGRQYTPVYTHANGGVALAPYLLEPGADNASFWLFDPIEFLREAFAVREFPIIDSTTESGRRILLSHIDGDGFVSRGEFPGSPLSAKVFLEQIINRYDLPRTVSVVEAETSPEGLFPRVSEEAEALARTLFRHPPGRGGLPYLQPSVFLAGTGGR